MRLTEAIKSYFSRYADEDDDEAKPLKKVYKKKKKVKAGSYFKKARADYEKMMEEAGDY